MSWISDDDRIEVTDWRFHGEDAPTYRFARSPFLRLTLVPGRLPAHPRFWVLLREYAAYGAVGVGLLSCIGVAAGVRL